MSKAMWFVIGWITGDWLGNWLTHVIYLAIIGFILLGKPLLCG